MGKTITDAFGGVATSLDEQRAIWAEAIHPDCIWEGPTFDPPIQMVGREACGRFFELLLEVVPQFTMQPVSFHPTADPETIVMEATGGGPTVDGGSYAQRYLSFITNRDGQAFRMREYCNPFQTYKAFGEQRWQDRVAEIMRDHNVPWPESQPADPAALPSG